MDAAKYGHAEVVKLLLEAGAIAIKIKEVSNKHSVTSIIYTRVPETYEIF